MRRHVLSISLFVLALSGGAASGAWPQGLELASRGPRFIAAWKPSAEALDASDAVALRRRVSLDLTNVTADEALKEITRQADLEISYSRSLLPSSKSVSLHVREITVAAALTEVLLDAGVDVAVARGGHMALVKRPAPTAVPVVDSGVVSGRVTDKATGAPIVGATVVIEGTRHSATTGSDGRYRIADVPSGTYSVRARYIGYALLSSSVTVRVGEDVTVDMALVRSVQLLEEVVTTGTVIPTEVKALPTPITIVGTDDIAQRRPQSLLDVVRQVVPSAVAFPIPSQLLVSSAISVRGVSSLSGSSSMKIYVDGVEASGFGASPVDPASIERVEIVRGPQAATIYGADAAGGVVQIFTKRGDPYLARPQVEVQGEVGIAQTPYAQPGDALRQRYTGSVRGGSGNLSYNVGGGYTRLGDYAPNGEPSWQSTPSVYGGARFAEGVLTVDLSSRYYQNRLPEVFNPLVQTTGFVPVSRPSYVINNFENETHGAQITVSPTSWWRNNVTLGVDRFSNEAKQTRPRFTTPDDTLFTVSDATSRKISVAYNATATRRLGTAAVGSVTAGIDHYDQYANTTFTSQAIQTTGQIETSPPGSFFENRATITNTGYFTQLQVGVRDALFLTAGLRADDNSTFGADLGTPVSPRVGISFVRQAGQATAIKVRGSYGRAVRAPSPGAALGGVAAFQITLANPLLRPERQQGWDAGFDLIFGSRASLSVTGYNQSARDLIAQVTLATDPILTVQSQNIGRVANKGLEVEGTLAFQSLQLKAQYSYVRSRIQDLGSLTVVGDLQVGDEPLGLPAHTAGGTVTVTPRLGTTLTAGFTYVGAYRQTDILALFQCLGGTGPCPSDFSFVANFPSFTKFNAVINQRITPGLEGFLSVDNLTNNQAYEGLTVVPVIGRITMVGLHLSY